MKFFWLMVWGGVLTSISFADVGVRGYYRQNGTYVAPHFRSSPNDTPCDNWSTKGNRNPHTGEMGKKNAQCAEEVANKGTPPPQGTGLNPHNDQAPVGGATAKEDHPIN